MYARQIHLQKLTGNLGRQSLVDYISCSEILNLICDALCYLGFFLPFPFWYVCQTTRRLISDYFQITLPLVCLWMLVPMPHRIIYLYGIWNMDMLQRWFLSYEMQKKGTQLSVYFDYTGIFALKHCYQTCPSRNSPI